MFKKLFNSIIGDTNEEEKGMIREKVEYQNEPDNDYEDNEEECEENGDEDAFDPSGNDTGEFDPRTLHGLHYTEEQFDEEVERQVQEYIRSEEEDGCDISDADIRNARFNFGSDLFLEWNGPSRHEKFHLLWGNKAHGFTTYGHTQEDENNPLLQPIHGVSLRDYSAMSSKIASGVELTPLLNALGIEEPVWAEANALWVARMQEDSSFAVINLMGKYFGEADQHPKLGNITNAAQQAGGIHPNVERINKDEMYYYELCGARQAAYEYGIDGAQWILDNFGITLGEFQSAASKWMLEQNQNFNSQDISRRFDYQDEMQKKYAAQFAKEQGGNVTDDISF